MFKIVDYIKSFLLCLDLEIESMIKENVIAQTDDTGKRIWLCVQCNYSQRWRNNVAKHFERIHLKSLNLTCPICSSAVNSRADLQIHIRNIHPDPLLK